MSVTRRNVSFEPDVLERVRATGRPLSTVIDEALRVYLELHDRPPVDRGANLRKVTREQVLAAVAEHGGNQAAAARALGVHESTISRHLAAAERKSTGDPLPS